MAAPEDELINEISSPLINLSSFFIKFSVVFTSIAYQL